MSICSVPRTMLAPRHKRVRTGDTVPLKASAEGHSKDKYWTNNTISKYTVITNSVKGKDKVLCKPVVKKIPVGRILFASSGSMPLLLYSHTRAGSPRGDTWPSPSQSEHCIVTVTMFSFNISKYLESSNPSQWDWILGHCLESSWSSILAFPTGFEGEWGGRTSCSHLATMKVELLHEGNAKEMGPRGREIIRCWWLFLTWIKPETDLGFYSYLS